MSPLIVPAGPGDPVRGSDSAPVTLVEYGDYECPFCGQAYVIVKSVQQNQSHLLRFIFRNFPLAQVHPHAFQAACAAEAAAIQGKFWEMHDLLFEHQNSLDDESLLRYGRLLRLNMKRFAADLAAEETIQKIRTDFRGGIRSGVNGTPTFFINGTRYDASYQYPVLIAALEKAAAEMTYG